MNRTYIPENSRENTAEHLTRVRSALELILCFFDLVIDFFSEESVRKTVRVFTVIACFFAFLFVIGAVETAAIGFGAGILASALLFSIAFFCVYRPMKHHN